MKNIVVIRDKMRRQLEGCLCKLDISKKVGKIQAHTERRKQMWNVIIATKKATCQMNVGTKGEVVRDKDLRVVEDPIEEKYHTKHKIP